MRKVLKKIVLFFELILMKIFSKKLKYQPVFIIGAPRTGSTILYQVITQAFDFCYINNYCNRNLNYLLTATLISKLRFGRKAHGSYTSLHGDTEGDNSPSECGSFWYQWLPEDRHFIDAGELSEKGREEIKAYVAAISNIHSRPVIFKNLNAGQRLRMLKEIFPDALFIYCKREQEYTAQSILCSKKRNEISLDTWWSIMPREYKELKNLPFLGQVASQVFYLEKEIEKSLSNLYPDNSLDVHYEKFCENPNSVLQEIQSFFAKHNVDIAFNKNVIDSAQIVRQDEELDSAYTPKLKEIFDKLRG